MARKAKAATKPARRKPGTGTIREKKDGRENSFEAAFPIGNGEYRYDYFSTRIQATAHLDQLTTQRDNKEAPRNVTGGSQRVDQFLVAFLNRKVNIGPTTKADYTYQCRIANTYIGGLRVDEVTRTVADNMFQHRASKGYKNLSQLRMVMIQAFDFAVEEEFIRKNPFKKIELPAVERRKNIALTLAERQRLLDVLAGDPLEVLFHLYSRLGLRFGEGLARMWKDVNWSESTLTIARHYVVVNGRNILRPYTKNKKNRTVPLPRDVLELLRGLSPHQREYASKVDNWQENGLIFPSEVGTPREQRNVMRTFKEIDNSIVKRASLPAALTIHDLRHTAAYHMEQAHIPKSVRKAILGHSTDAMSGHYADHALEDMPAMRAAIDREWKVA
jgi:integrase